MDRINSGWRAWQRECMLRAIVTELQINPHAHIQILAASEESSREIFAEIRKRVAALSLPETS